MSVLTAASLTNHLIEVMRSWIHRHVELGLVIIIIVTLEMHRQLVLARRSCLLVVVDGIVLFKTFIHVLLDGEVAAFGGRLVGLRLQLTNLHYVF